MEVARLDVAIRDGLVIDGSGQSEPARLDVGIVDGRIVALGDLGTRPADRIIDATGRIVAPGFIDPHVHVETAILAERPDAVGPVLQGVTTILTAPDGFGWAPLDPSAARELWAATAAIHGPLPSALDSQSPAAYLAGFADRTPVNVVAQIPGAALRFAAMGWSPGPAGPAGLDLMRALAMEWLDAGATGLAVGLDYEPGARADEAELTALCETVAARGGGLAAHIRYEDAGRAAGYAEMGRIAARTGVRVTLAHERLDAEAMNALARMEARHRVWIECYGYNASSTHLGILLPQEERAGGPAGLADRLRRPPDRARIASLLERRLAEDRSAGDRVVFAASADPDRVGSDIHEVAAAAGVTVGEYAAACLANDPMALFVYHHDGRRDHDDVEARTWADPRTIVASDGIYLEGRMHPRGYGTYPRMLRRAVRERQVLALPAAIHAMTARTAARYRIPDRGIVAVGAAADIVVFDPVGIMDRADWDHPCRPPIGIDHVLVNGVTVVTNGVATGARPGRVLRASP